MAPRKKLAVAAIISGLGIVGWKLRGSLLISAILNFRDRIEEKRRTREVIKNLTPLSLNEILRIERERQIH